MKIKVGEKLPSSKWVDKDENKAVKIEHYNFN